MKWRRLFGWLMACIIIVVSCGAWAPMFDETRANTAVRFFENLKHTIGDYQGKPFILFPWEKQIIRDVYGTLDERGRRQYRTVWVEIPKKNGKSELAAGAALLHLFADGEQSGEIYGCAGDKKQATIVFNVAKNMIGLVPALKKRARIIDSLKTIEDTKTGSVYQVLSSEAFTKHGLNVSACIFDEIHAQPNRDLWDVMTTGAGIARRQPIWWVITTAGDDPDRVSVGWEQHEYAQKVKSGEIVDPSWYVMVFNYLGDDIYNEANWYQANPSLGLSIEIEDFRILATKAKHNPADERNFRWLHLNQWTTYKLTTWQPLELFASTVGAWNRTDLVGLDCYLGMDLSSTTDLTALALVFPPQDGLAEWRVIWECYIPRENMIERVRKDHVPYDEWAEQGWITVTEGNVVDYTVIEAKILEMAKVYNIVECDADRAFAAMFLQRLEQAGITTVDVPQTFANETDPLNLMETLLKKNEMTHENSPVASWCFGNASVAKNGNGMIKLVKEHKGKSVVRTKRIDLVSAWMDGVARARFHTGASPDLSATILSDNWGM